MWKTNTNIDNKKILLDCDVFRHFLKAKMLDKLLDTFPGQLYFIEMVYIELVRSATLKKIVTKLIGDKSIKFMKFPKAKKYTIEYLELSKANDGWGENACLAVAKFSEDVVASNNLTDIKTYCEENSILYLTTTDILYCSYAKGVMDESEIDYFLYLNLQAANPSKIPFNNLQEIIASNPDVAIIFK